MGQRRLKRRRSAWVPFLLLGSTLAGAAACQPSSGVSPTDRLYVTVSILPQRYFVERIGGDRVSVMVMVPPGAEPATYEPKPEQLRQLSRSAAYFRIRVPFEEAWMGRISGANPGMRLVDITQGVDRMERDGEIDPHIWLSPRLVKIQAQTIATALADLDPSSAPVYRTNLERFLAEVDALDEDIRRSLSHLARRTFLVFHPSWGYFARDYGLTMMAVEVGGQEPSAAEMAEIIARTRAAGIRVIFAQPQFGTRSAEIIAHEIGGEVLVIDPLAPDWPDNLRMIAETFARVLDAQARP